MDPSTTTDTPLPPTLVRPATAPVDGSAVQSDGLGDRAVLEEMLFEMKKVIVQDRAIERLLICLLTTDTASSKAFPAWPRRSVETLASVAGGTFTRMQFTPDLLPADIVGTRIYRAVDRDGSTSSSARCSPTSSSPMRSTVRRRRCSPRCSR